MRIHAALCRICGEGIKKAGEQVCPAVRPFWDWLVNLTREAARTGSPFRPGGRASW